MELKSAEKYLMRVYLSTKNDSYREALAEVLAALRETDAKQKEYEQFMERWGEAVKIAGAVKDIGAKRIAELVQADREGRCVVLPCKVGDATYTVGASICKWREIDQCDEYCDGWEYRDCWEGGSAVIEGKFCIDDLNRIGKTVFLTREAAEKALEMEEKANVCP